MFVPLPTDRNRTSALRADFGRAICGPRDLVELAPLPIVTTPARPPPRFGSRSASPKLLPQSACPHAWRPPCLSLVTGTPPRALEWWSDVCSSPPPPVENGVLRSYLLLDLVAQVI